MSGTQNAAGSVARTNTPASGPKVEGSVLTDGQIASLRADAKAEGHAEAVAAGRLAERERMSAILGCEEAEGRGDLAKHFAFETDVSADAAKAALAKSPKLQPRAEAKGNRFDEAMQAAGNPSVGLEPTRGDDDDAAALVGSVMAAYRGIRTDKRGTH